MKKVFSGYLSAAQREALFASLLSSMTGLAVAILTESRQKPVIIAAGIFVALSLFLLRLRFRVVYGAIEVVFGLYVLWDAAGKGRGSFSSGFSSGFDTFQISVVLIQTFGAIYILIRGLDNLLQGLPANTRERFETRVKEWQI
ncbi:hypothetical protein JJE66_33665 [Bradyrhizobium diazoefficiens]|uniref:hypothetical protein n=1 Tax=Bradyrhizobium diazoefficiens TaxID=1355477 RepID=UPI00190CAF98|nr:hypothetical protein [Bradyrhizobium diazoefficiens]MBK3666156.1 hypothetical protein [Bradyrhizobium diazoefficiens]